MDDDATEVANLLAELANSSATHSIPEGWTVTSYVLVAEISNGTESTLASVMSPHLEEWQAEGILRGGIRIVLNGEDCQGCDDCQIDDE